MYYLQINLSIVEVKPFLEMTPGENSDYDDGKSAFFSGVQRNYCVYLCFSDDQVMGEIDISMQLPDPLNKEESQYYNDIYVKSGEMIQTKRIHCTACNIHLGSSPNQQHNRFIHPLLKVLVCKKCLEFYISGEFERGEDGSELYCRWCGQGGVVFCCSNEKEEQCPYVFCKVSFKIIQGFFLAF